MTTAPVPTVSAGAATVNVTVIRCTTPLEPESTISVEYEPGASPAGRKLTVSVPLPVPATALNCIHGAVLVAVQVRPGALIDSMVLPGEAPETPFWLSDPTPGTSAASTRRVTWMSR